MLKQFSPDAIEAFIRLYKKEYFCPCNVCRLEGKSFACRLCYIKPLLCKQCNFKECKTCNNRFNND